MVRQGKRQRYRNKDTEIYKQRWCDKERNRDGEIKTQTYRNSDSETSKETDIEK